MKELSAMLSDPEQTVLNQGSDRDAGDPHDSDDEPMVYETPKDYVTWARQERGLLISSGRDPDSVVLQSEIRNHVPRRENEAPGAYTQRYVETMQAMIKRGVTILNDMCKADVQPSVFETAGGRRFNLGPGSGVTKGEFREFCRWFRENAEGVKSVEVPEKLLKYEKPAEEASK